MIIQLTYFIFAKAFWFVTNKAPKIKLLHSQQKTMLLAKIQLISSMVMSLIKLILASKHEILDNFPIRKNTLKTIPKIKNHKCTTKTKL